MKFVRLPLQEQKLLNRLEQSPTFIKCFTKDITDAFFSELEQRSHIILFMWGETGTFKSSAIMEILETKDPTFNFNHISFHNQQMLDQIAISIIGGAYMRDENPYDVGIGSGRARQQIGTVSETLRKRENSLGFVSASYEHVATAHYILQTIDATMTENEVRKKLKAGEKVEDVFVRIGVQDPQNLNFLGYIIVKVRINNKVWLEYDKKKDIAMEEYATMSYGQIQYEEIAEKELEEIDLEKYRKKGERALYLHTKFKNKFTTKEIKMIHTALEMQLREAMEKEEEGFSNS